MFPRLRFIDCLADEPQEKTYGKSQDLIRSGIYVFEYLVSESIGIVLVEKDLLRRAK